MPQLKRKAGKKAKRQRMHEEMHKYKQGTLRSSSGKKVTNRKQAIANRTVGIRSITQTVR